MLEDIGGFTVNAIVNVGIVFIVIFIAIILTKVNYALDIYIKRGDK